MKLNSKKDGFVALMGVLILGIVLAFLVPTMLLTSTDNLKMSSGIIRSNQALTQAESCMETSLEKFRQNSSYAGNETITLPQGTCSIQTITGTGAIRTFQTSSTVDNYTKKVRVITSQVSPQIIISSWREVSDF